jgi:hypothetical protein
LSRFSSRLAFALQAQNSFPSLSGLLSLFHSGSTKSRRRILTCRTCRETIYWWSRGSRASCRWRRGSPRSAARV